MLPCYSLNLAQTAIVAPKWPLQNCGRGAAHWSVLSKTFTSDHHRLCCCLSLDGRSQAAVSRFPAFLLLFSNEQYLGSNCACSPMLSPSLDFFLPFPKLLPVNFNKNELSIFARVLIKNTHTREIFCLGCRYEARLVWTLLEQTPSSTRPCRDADTLYYTPLWVEHWSAGVRITLISSYLSLASW